MISVLDSIEYFENLARSHKKIKHTDEKKAFSHGDIDELLNDISGHSTDGYSLLFENGDGSVKGENEDQAIETGHFAVVICRPVNNGDKSDQAQAENESKQILFQILAKMQKDKSDEVALVLDFDLLSFQYEKIYGFGNNHFGYRGQFNLIVAALDPFNPDDWEFPEDED